MDEHKIALSKLFKDLNSSAKGLSEKEVGERIEKYGKNILQTKKKELLIVKLLKQFANFFALLLLFGAGLAYIAECLDPGQGNLYIAIALAGVTVLNAIFTFLQEYQSERIMASFKNMMPDEVQVLRYGKEITIKGEDLVPGDILYLEEGDKIPADGRLIEQNSLKVDNSSITGESEPQLRKLVCTHENMLESRNMVFSGTLVQTGNGKAIVYATGMKTQIGKLVKLTKETKNVDTPLHKELKHFISIISAIAIILGVVFFFLSILFGKQLIGSLIFAIGIIVANVPEGLLPTVTLALSMTAKRMAKKNALVKNLESVETLGSTTVICTDKTGTLTQNKMTVSSLYINHEEIGNYEKGVKERDIDILLKTMTLCNNAKYNVTLTGDPTETALLSFSKRFLDIPKLTKKFARIHESPFDSKTKRMITINKEGSKKIAHMKGAPEVVLRKCSKIIINKKVRKLNKNDHNEILKYYKKLASRGERVLGFAYKATKTDKASEKDFIFIGLAGMVDPPRKGVTGSIAECKSAGIKVIMITGDYSLTAEAIGKKVGLVDPVKGASIVTGEQLERMDEATLRKKLNENDLIFARAAPRQKLRIVKALQSMGEVVTVTGDGVNDAPALKNADMGVAMGIGGTEVAREASDMVLMDDNFATIVTAIEEGRTIFENIKKFIAYILTSNIPEISPFIAFALLPIPLPLTVILILSIDLGTDIVPALGLGVEKPEEDVMKNKPRKRTERLLTGNMLRVSYGIIGMIQAAAGFFTFFWILNHGGWVWGQELAFNNPLYMKAVAGFFSSIIIAQIADVFICRTRRQSSFKVGFFSNKLILFGIATELFLLWIIVFFEPTQAFFGTAPLTLLEMSLAIPFAIAIIIFDEIRTYSIRKGNKFFVKYLAW